MKEQNFEIWSEGYRCTGESSGAMLHGTSNGKDFKTAVVNFANQNKEFSDYYDEESNTYWGCCLFDNERDARKSFG